MLKSFIVKGATGIVGLGLLLITFQNCNNVKFGQVPEKLSLSSLAAPVTPGLCSASDVACETDRYRGRQVCDNSADGPIYGVCVFQACKPPFALVNGMCQTPVCQSGDKKTCEYKDPVTQFSATGLRLCENNGWGTCNWIKLTVGGLSAVSLNVEKTYVFEVRTSDPSIVVDQSSLKFVSGSCKGGNPSPWILNDKPLAIGPNSLLYKGTVVDNMTGCVWNGEVNSNISGVSSSIIITASTPVPTTCANGGTNPPTCTAPTCLNGATNYPTCTSCLSTRPNFINGQCYANCTNGGTNPPTCTAPTCLNGATNYPTCTSCPITTPNLVSGQCYANCANGGTNPPTCTAPTCTNGGTNYPTCTAPTCLNGATNYPTCSSCPATRPNFVNGQCYANCSNGGTNPPTCTAPTCLNGATNYPTCTSCPSTRPNFINGQCYANCANGGTNPPTCTAPTCSNGATNYPTCTSCPTASPNLVSGQCYANCANGATNPPICTAPTCSNGATNYPICTAPNCTNGGTNYPTCTPPTCLNGATNYPTCTSCPVAQPNFVNGQCYANCTNGGTNPPTCTAPTCANGATNYPTCTSCPVATPNLVNGQCYANCTNGGTNPPTCTAPTCSNGATNYPTCSSCPTDRPNYAGGQCYANCANGGTNPPTCTAPTCSNGATNYPTCSSCPTDRPNYVGGQCYANCANGGTNPPTCTAPTCANSATDYPTCTSCPSDRPNYLGGQCYANCANGGTNPPSCTLCANDYVYDSGQCRAYRSCNFNGSVIPHTGFVDVFNTSSVQSPSSCISQRRTCNDGILGGDPSYTVLQCTNLPADVTPVSCTNLSNVQGDMNVNFTNAGGGFFNLSFGTIGDNYWGNGQYDRQMSFYIDDLSQISSMVLNQAQFDDWIWVKVNDQTVYMGPHPDWGITSIERVIGYESYYESYVVATNIGNQPTELGTSWVQYPNVDIKPYLHQGINTVFTRTIVGGNGESYINMSMGRTCSGSNDPTPTPTPTPIGPRPSCFVAGTQVSMKDGSTKSIEDIEVGEQILTYDEQHNQYTVSPVEEVLHHESKLNTLYTFTFEASSVTSNDVHLIYVPKEKRYLPAEQIFERWMKGENFELLSKDNKKAENILSIQRSYKNIPLYNLHVTSPADRTSSLGLPMPGATGHNYFVGGVLVHNYKQEY